MQLEGHAAAASAASARQLQYFHQRSNSNIILTLASLYKTNIWKKMSGVLQSYRWRPCPFPWTMKNLDILFRLFFAYRPCQINLYNGSFTTYLRRSVLGHLGFTRNMMQCACTSEHKYIRIDCPHIFTFSGSKFSAVKKSSGLHDRVLS